jgi:glutathionyl-hydroquinone reductase
MNTFTNYQNKFSKLLTRNILIFFLITFYSIAVYAQCGSNITGIASTSPCYSNHAGTYTIPVYVHVMVDENSDPINEADIVNMIPYLNSVFDDSVYDLDDVQKFEFVLANYDEYSRCFSGIKYHEVSDAEVDVL